MLLLIQTVLGIAPGFLHVNLQITPYNHTEWHLGTDEERHPRLLRGRNLSFNARIHNLGEGKGGYRIFIDEEKICHIGGVVQECGDNMAGESWRIVPISKEGGFIIKNGNSDSNICITQRRWDKSLLTMEECDPESKMQHWKIRLPGRPREGGIPGRGRSLLEALDRRGSQESPENIPIPIG